MQVVYDQLLFLKMIFVNQVLIETFPMRCIVTLMIRKNGMCSVKNTAWYGYEYCNTGGAFTPET